MTFTSTSMTWSRPPKAREPRSETTKKRLNKACSDSTRDALWRGWSTRICFSKMRLKMRVVFVAVGTGHMFRGFSSHLLFFSAFSEFFLFTLCYRNTKGATKTIWTFWRNRENKDGLQPFLNLLEDLRASAPRCWTSCHFLPVSASPRITGENVSADQSWAASIVLMASLMAKPSTWRSWSF